MSGENILIVIKNPHLGKLLKDNTLNPAGYKVTLIPEKGAAQSVLYTQTFEAIILDDGDSFEQALQFSEQILENHPGVSLILLSSSSETALIFRAFRLGVSDFLTLPLKPAEVLRAVETGVKRSKKLQTWVRRQTRRDTDSLRRHVDELKELEKIGRSVTASLDLDHILTIIVDTAVKLTGAEEGSLLFLDDDSGELMMRAARNFQDEFVRTFRLPVRDTLAGDVIRTGVPVMINEETPQKIKTRYLVHALMYVPLQIKGKVFGVLGVDNRERVQGFTQQHLSLVSTLADYAAIAIENARLYNDTEVERQKLDSILTQIEDGVIVVGPDHRVILVNPNALMIFGLGDLDVVGKPVGEVFKNDDLLEMFATDHGEMPFRSEIELEDGYILNAQMVEIPNVGFAITIQDITYFKELDRIKTEFVQTVSHDLRSPLTAILGYVELIMRVGEVNEQQREFIDRVQISVRNIAELINDLLELGRIEAGFDTRKEYVPLGVIMQYAVDGVRNQIDKRNHQLTINIEDDIPNAYGDPARLRQVVDILLNNAVRYTLNGGQITLRLRSQKKQIILQVEDNGLGIPLQDQPYIFEKFYRSSNVPENISGSGLGLAIVKSIV
ncbi:MAG: GAF domain-containing protein [Anaerolineales bacterium]|nr:GAF domain-containing protein [Anaerolineales bacterium]